MNKILQNMAKRNMAKAAAMMMAIFASQQGQAGVWDSLASGASTAMSGLASGASTVMSGLGNGLTVMKDYAVPAITDFAMKAYENPWAAAGTVLGTAATVWGGKKLYNYWHQPSVHVDNTVNDTQTKQIKNIQNNMSVKAYPTGNNLGKSLINQQKKPEGMLNNNTSVNESLDTKTVKLVNKAKELGIDVSVDEGKFFVDEYEDGFDKGQMEAYLVSKEAENNEILQNTEQTNDVLPNGFSFVTEEEYNKLIEQNSRLKDAQIVKQKMGGYKVLDKDGVIVSVDHYFRTLGRGK